MFATGGIDLAIVFWVKVLCDAMFAERMIAW
jgi:hypothetical protein